MTTRCTVFRCSRQSEMYLYVRADLQPDQLPEALRKLTGQLHRVMDLELGPERKLARVETARVVASLQGSGYFLQMPPNGVLEAHLHFGD